MLKIGVLGLGVGEKHLQAYLSHPDCNVTWLCDRDANRLSQFSKFDRPVRLTTEVDEVLESGEVDVVSIATNDEYHFEQAKQALENNIHVFVEKPVCLKADELEILSKLCLENEHLKLSSNLVLRTCPFFVQIKEDILNNRYGDIYFLEADYLWGRREKLIHGWRRRTEGYSIVLGAAIHMLDLVVWLLGERPARVQAMATDRGIVDTAVDRNSFGIALLEFANGAIAKVSGNGACVHPHFHRLEIYGSQATIKHNLENRAAYEFGADGEIILGRSPDGAYPGKQERYRVIHSFIDSILDEMKSPLVVDKEVFDLMTLGFAVEEAIKTKKVVEVKYGH